MHRKYRSNKKMRALHTCACACIHLLLLCLLLLLLLLLLCCAVLCCAVLCCAQQLCCAVLNAAAAAATLGPPLHALLGRCCYTRAAPSCTTGALLLHQGRPFMHYWGAAGVRLIILQRIYLANPC